MPGDPRILSYLNLVRGASILGVSVTDALAMPADLFEIGVSIAVHDRQAANATADLNARAESARRELVGRHARS